MWFFILEPTIRDFTIGTLECSLLAWPFGRDPLLGFIHSFSFRNNNTHQLQFPDSVWIPIFQQISVEKWLQFLLQLFNFGFINYSTN
jgi:hypothetical protein